MRWSVLCVIFRAENPGVLGWVGKEDREVVVLARGLIYGFGAKVS